MNIIQGEREADLYIVQTALEFSRSSIYVAIDDITDLLVLLLHNGQQQNNQIVYPANLIAFSNGQIFKRFRTFRVDYNKLFQWENTIVSLADRHLSYLPTINQMGYGLLENLFQ